jgi:glycosyltransferase involved in cell wall biosynthesis
VPKSRIKVLYLSNFPDVDKGGQISLYNLVKRLDRRVFEPTVLCPKSGALSALFSEKGIPVQFLEFPQLRIRNLLQILRAVLRFRKMVLEGGFSLIHSDSPRDTFLSAVSLIFTKRQIVWHARVSTRGPIFDPINKHLASRIICVSNAVKGRFEPCPSNKCIVIYNGVDPSKFAPQSSPGPFKQEVNIPNDSLLVSTIMQVIPSKGAEEFVEAAVRLCEKVQNVSFVVVGVWTDDAFIEKLRGIAHPFRDRVHFLGYRRNIWDVLNDSDVFVLPSWRYLEGLPRVVIEAMACRVPVVGTDVEGTNEAVVQDETGLLVPHKDAASLAGAIMKLIDDPQLRTRFGENGRQRVQEVFDIKEHVNKVESLYRGLLEKNR